MDLDIVSLASVLTFRHLLLSLPLSLSCNLDCYDFYDVGFDIMSMVLGLFQSLTELARVLTLKFLKVEVALTIFSNIFYANLQKYLILTIKFSLLDSVNNPLIIFESLQERSGSPHLIHTNTMPHP